MHDHDDGAAVTYDRVFAALAHAARRQILITLSFEGGSMGAGDIARMFAHAWPTTTRHLQVLADAGLVIPERHGRTRTYRLDLRHIELVREWLAWLPDPVSRREDEPRSDT